MPNILDKICDETSDALIYLDFINFRTITYSIVGLVGFHITLMILCSFLCCASEERFLRPKRKTIAQLGSQVYDSVKRKTNISVTPHPTAHKNPALKSGPTNHSKSSVKKQTEVRSSSQTAQQKRKANKKQIAPDSFAENGKADSFLI